jgi:hypothetical protein
MALRKRPMHVTTDEVHWHGMERGDQSQPRLPNKADKESIRRNCLTHLFPSQDAQKKEAQQQNCV